jgi:hypothetical protein
MSINGGRSGAQVHQVHSLKRMICTSLVLPCLLLGGCLGGGSYYVSPGAEYSTSTLARYGNSTSCSCPPANPFAKGYVQTTNPFGKDYVQTTNPFGKGYVQDTNPFGKGYVQDTNPFGKGYVQDKCLVGLDD